MREEKVLQQATFDQKLPSYWMLSTLVGLTFTVIGIPFIPLFLIFGWAFFRKRYDVLECTLTERTLHVKRGVIFRSEKNVPLDKIQDISMTEGPLLRKLGLASLHIETAGQSAQSTADASLTGIVDSPAFRDAILEQRDKVVASGSRSEPASPAAAVSANDEELQLLREMRDSLGRIERALSAGDGDGVGT